MSLKYNYEKLIFKNISIIVKMEYYESFKKNFDSTDSGEIIYEQNEYYVNSEIVVNNRAINGDIVYIEDSKVVGIKTRKTILITGILHLNKKGK